MFNQNKSQGLTPADKVRSSSGEQSRVVAKILPPWKCFSKEFQGILASKNFGWIHDPTLVLYNPNGIVVGTKNQEPINTVPTIPYRPFSLLGSLAWKRIRAMKLAGAKKQEPSSTVPTIYHTVLPVCYTLLLENGIWTMKLIGAKNQEPGKAVPTIPYSTFSLLCSLAWKRIRAMKLVGAKNQEPSNTVPTISYSTFSSLCSLALKKQYEQWN